MAYKPSDFFFSAYDVFGVLLPGAFFMAIAAYSAFDFPVKAAAEGWGWTPAERWITLGFCTYLVGHLISVLGSLVEDLYHRLHRASIAADYAGPREAALRTLKRLFPDAPVQLGNVRHWARIYLEVHASDTVRHAVEQVRAQRRFFRNICVVAAISLLCPVVRRPGWGMLVLLGLIAFLSFQRYRHMQSRCTQRIVDYFLVAVSPSPGDALPGPDAPAVPAQPSVELTLQPAAPPQLPESEPEVGSAG